MVPARAPWAFFVLAARNAIGAHLSVRYLASKSASGRKIVGVIATTAERQSVAGRRFAHTVA